MFNTYREESWLRVHYRTVRRAVEIMLMLGSAAFCSYVILHPPWTW